jgi:hypothetical protein
MGMMKAGIVVDDWKLPVFRKQLDAAGFSYEEAGKALLPGTTLLRVQTSDLNKLNAVLEACQAECKRSKN